MTDDPAPHQPSLPHSPPPQRLIKLAQHLRHPSIANIGLTTTSEGHWALRIRVLAGHCLPDGFVKEAAGDVPVVIEDALPELPVARPAFPADGE